MDIQSFSQNVRTLEHSDDNKTTVPKGQSVSELAHAKNADKTEESNVVSAKRQLNAAILQSAVDVSAGNKSLSLVFKAALEGINDALKETMGDNAIQNSYDSDLDVSPQATADRIVSLSTAFFGAYQEQHPELAQDEALTKFTEIIRGGIDTGFGQARDVLSGLKVLEGDIATNIDKTYDLVQQGLAAFIKTYE